MANLNAGMIARLRMPLPSTEEQERIVQLIEAENQKSDTAIARLEREIELLREYRTRLVADVVTGKLDVRPVASQMPAEPLPAEPLTPGLESRLQDEPELEATEYGA
jgi:restriction endonuclease S subunit